MNQTAPLKVYRPDASAAIEMRDFNAWFADAHILRNIRLSFRENRITCLVGPSGSGKSTLIRSINRINDDVSNYSCTGEIQLSNENILAAGNDVAKLRTRVGMVFQKPCVFPTSIAGNVLFGIRHLQKLSRPEKQTIVEENLRAAALWKEVKHRLQDKASSLSLGQQQRLCIARTLAVKPDIILLDEPTASLDPVSSRAIEDLMRSLKEKYTIVFVSHNIQQARRVADDLAFLCAGKLIEYGSSQQLFSNPTQEKTGKYLNEEFCDC